MIVRFRTSSSVFVTGMIQGRYAEELWVPKTMTTKHSKVFHKTGKKFSIKRFLAIRGKWVCHASGVVTLMVER